MLGSKNANAMLEQTTFESISHEYESDDDDDGPNGCVNKVVNICCQDIRVQLIMSGFCAN